jgi:hypothetical protein
MWLGKVEVYLPFPLLLLELIHEKHNNSTLLYTHR